MIIRLGNEYEIIGNGDGYSTVKHFLPIGTIVKAISIIDSDGTCRVVAPNGVRQTIEVKHLRKVKATPSRKKKEE